MKTFLTILSLAIIVSACNNSTDENTELPEQEKNLKTEIKKFPDSVVLKENLIQYYADNSNYTQAIAEIDKFIQKDTANPRWWDLKANLYFQNNDTLNTIKSFERAIEIFPNPEYIISLGTVYAQTRNPMALTMADALLQAPKAQAELQALYIKGLYYNYTGDHNKAIPFFDECIRMNYTFMDSYVEKAVAYYEMGKYETALQVVQKGMAIQPTFFDGYYWAGRCYEKLNKRDEAIKHYQMAIQTAAQADLDYIEAKDALGKLGVKY
ncbi:MAG: tetratricopeptide repeat protein [Bacteroidota bacterium]